MKLSVLCLMVFLVQMPAYGATEDDQVLARNLKDLYVVHTPLSISTEETEQELDIVLTLNSYQGDLNADVVSDPGDKYEIFIGDKDLKIIKTFAFYFGGPSQFAVKISGESELLIGKVGEYVKADLVKAFAGLRADPSFYDLEGYRKFLSKRCLPKVGFRCEGEGEVENFFQNKNVMALALSINIKYLADIDGSYPNNYSVWAKAYKRDE